VVDHATVQAAGSRASGFRIGGDLLGRGGQGLDLHEQALLARVEAPIGREQDVEIAGQPSRGTVVKADAVPPAEGRADLLLVGMDVGPRSGRFLWIIPVTSLSG
jgi:hypothetical protein